MQAQNLRWHLYRKPSVPSLSRQSEHVVGLILIGFRTGSAIKRMQAVDLHPTHRMVSWLTDTNSRPRTNRVNMPSAKQTVWP